ncbi:MAG: hypothetical protein ACRCW9_06480 [Cetobacterium sp.]
MKMNIMMRINIYPKFYVEKQTSLEKDKVLISILSPIETSLTKECKERYLDVLELRFEDLPFDASKIEELKEEYTRVFNEKDFELIKNFVSEYKNNSIDIHCAAGVSRSSAVALGICFIKEDKELLKDTILRHPFIYPNERILCFFRLLLNIVDQDFTLRNVFDLISTNKAKKELLHHSEKIIKECGLNDVFRS